MPATNYTPIQLYRSTTSGNVPSAANLSAGEIALNIADNDMTMYFENASGTVKRFFNNPAALKYPTADGTSGQVMRTDGAGVLSFAAVPSTALTNNTRQAVTSSATTTIDLNSGNVVDLTMAANITTLSFTNVPASGTPILVQIVVRNASDGTAYTIAWPSSVYWSGQYALLSPQAVQTAPTLATGANGVTVIALLTTDGGTKWRGWVEASIPGFSGNQLYVWANGASGASGRNNTTNTSSPTQVGSLTNWARIAAGQQTVYAVKTDGTLWSWGNNDYGGLGQNLPVLTNVSSPVQIGAATDWASVAAGKNRGLFIKTGGTLWAVGRNTHGALGLGDVVHRSSPVQVGALTNWSQAASSRGTFQGTSAAVKTDGTLWAWGYNYNGQLGQNNRIYTSSPVQVGALTDWYRIGIAGDGGPSLVAVKTNNQLWAVGGQNNTGLMGISSVSPLSSPVQIGALSNWANIASGYLTFAATKTDNTLWSWGASYFASLGNGSTGPGYNKSSPVQIGAGASWATGDGKVSVGTWGGLAVTTDNKIYYWGRNDFFITTAATPTQFAASLGSIWNQVSRGVITNGGTMVAITTDSVSPA